MKLNIYQAWHFHYIARIKQPFKLWLKTKKHGMYDIPEADDNEEFKKWLLEERKKNEKAETSLLEG